MKTMIVTLTIQKELFASSKADFDLQMAELRTKLEDDDCDVLADGFREDDDGKSDDELEVERIAAEGCKDCDNRGTPTCDTCGW